MLEYVRIRCLQMSLENADMETMQTEARQQKEALWMQYIRMGRKLEQAGALRVADLFYKRGEELAYQVIDPAND